MTLTDQEILELNELCSAVVDETLTDAQRARLTRWLAESEAARRHYVRALGQSASLYSYAGEMQAEAPDALVPTTPPSRRGWWLWIGGSFAAAAAVALVLWFANFPARYGPVAPDKTEDFVARLTGSKDLQWSDAAAAPRPGDHVNRGQKLALSRGLVEITFDSGARVVLEGPAVLDVNSAWDATLRRGTLKASVPPEAIGFRISNPAVEVVDLGTEFTMIADASGAAEVLVLKGEVEAAPRVSSDQETILLRENESRRFADSGVSVVHDSERKFALFTQPLGLDRLVAAGNFVHWSFDEAGGDMLRAESLGATPGAFDAQLHALAPEKLSSARTEGRRARALQFDGRMYARAKFPGLSGSAPHTVAFWVKVAEDAPLSDAFTMVAWGTQVKKLGSRPVHINWNRNPAEGPLGALRTDFGGGHAMGTTSLRDGRWHHLAISFTPGAEDDAPVQVKQYVDGRLESSTIVPGKTRAPAGTGDPALTDVVWLGCRLGNTGPRQDRFRGEMDELFIADRGLEPNEIVALMKDNRPPATALVAANP